MCVIVYKPAGVPIADSIIKDCFTENPNGAGYTIIHTKDAFVTRKGFMTVDELLTDLATHGELTPLSLVLHFRIMTSGELNPINTHPYPITHKPNLFTQTELPNIPVVYHNGILFGHKQSWTTDIDTYSDTFLLARDILSRTDNLGIENTLSLIANTTTNKFVTVSKRGNVTLYGTFTKHKDIYFSNMYWNEPPIVKHAGATWNGRFWTYGEGAKKTVITTAEHEKTNPTQYCKSCGSFLLEFERDKEICMDCEDKIAEYRRKKKAKNTTAEYCTSCGVILIEHEKSVHVCDDCLDWYTKPENYCGG